MCRHLAIRIEVPAEDAIARVSALHARTFDTLTLAIIYRVERVLTVNIEQALATGVRRRIAVRLSAVRPRAVTVDQALDALAFRRVRRLRDEANGRGCPTSLCALLRASGARSINANLRVSTLIIRFAADAGQRSRAACLGRL